jgi:hypothetical protein
MKLSKETFNIIKNYASINNNLVIKPGNKLSTIAVGNTIFSYTNVAEVFPLEFAIYDVNELLSVLSLFNDPDLEFTEKYLTLKEGNSSLKYFAAANTSNLVIPPNKEVDLTSDINFDLPASTLNTIRQTAPVLKVTDISIIGNGETISVAVADKKNATSNNYSVQLGTTTKEFKVNVKVDNIKMLPGDYSVTVANKGIKFKSKTTDLVYFVAIEADSTFPKADNE